MPTPDHPRTQGSKMEILPEAHGRSTEQNQPLENLRKRKLWRTTEKKSSVTVRQHFVLTNARYPSLPRLPLFYSSRREAVSPVYITLILCLFGQRYSSILPTEYCYLGFDFCTYLSTIQQRACPRVRAGSHTLYTVCAWGRFSSRHPPPPNRASTGMRQNWVPAGENRSSLLLLVYRFVLRLGLLVVAVHAS